MNDQKDNPPMKRDLILQPQEPRTSSTTALPSVSSLPKGLATPPLGAQDHVRVFSLQSFIVTSLTRVPDGLI